MGHDPTEFLRKGLFEFLGVFTHPGDADVDLPYNGAVFRVVEGNNVGKGIVKKVSLVQVSDEGI